MLRTMAGDAQDAQRDEAAHWLYGLAPEAWLRSAMNELASARQQYAQHDARAGLTSARRAGGMAWNAVLALQPEPDPAFGRTYVEHLRALGDGAAHGEPIPEAVREAARALLQEPEPRPGALVQLLSPRREGRLVDAAETVVAEAYVRLLRRGLLDPPRLRRP
jgi:hypothetical protein